MTNDDDLGRRAEIIREKGTNRAQFLRGEVDKYTWVDVGSSYVISDLLAALLQAQLLRLEEITSARRHIWDWYYEHMEALQQQGLVILPRTERRARHNGHIYAFRVAERVNQRDYVLAYMRSRGIEATFHFVPLHSSPFGLRHLGYRRGDFPITERVSESLIRLPLYPDLIEPQLEYILQVLNDALTHSI